MSFTDILHDPHFCNLVAIIRFPLHSREWRVAHHVVRFSLRMASLELLMTWQHFENAQGRNEFARLFKRLLEDIQQADPRLRSSEGDMQWLLGVMDQEDALIPMSMLWASAYAQDRYLTPAEIAAQTGTSQSNWRNKAAAGHFPGAIKRGKVWLIPSAILRSRGII